MNTLRTLFASVICTFAMCFYSSLGHAQEAAIPCDPEPTINMATGYGDSITCQFDSIGDLDSFVFTGTAGELIEWTLTDRSTSITFGTSEPIAELFKPSDPINPIDTLAIAETGITSQIQLPDESGTYQIRVREQGDNETGNYSIALQRLFPHPP